MHPARLLILEKKRKWAVVLRRELGEANIRVWEVRSRRDCLAELQQSPASLVGFEVTRENVEQVHQLLIHVSGAFPDTRCVVLGQTDTATFESMLREAGAVHAVFNLRQMGSVAELAQRHLSAATVKEMPLKQAIMARLPWGD